MSFPFDIETKNSKVKIPYEYGFDFNTGTFTGAIVEKKDAIKIWIFNALRTPRYRHLIYSWDYGSETDDLLRRTYTKEYLETECKRMVKECLTMNSYINDISNFSVTINDNKTNISFAANTIYGEVEIYV
jgi:uncharacterized protein (UPF0276 family)